MQVGISSSVTEPEVESSSGEFCIRQMALAICNERHLAKAGVTFAHLYLLFLEEAEHSLG